MYQGIWCCCYNIPSHLYIARCSLTTVIKLTNTYITDLALWLFTVEDLVLLFILLLLSNKDDVTLNNLMKAKLVIFSHPREKFTSGEVSNGVRYKFLVCCQLCSWPSLYTPSTLMQCNLS